jgi:hypothetical protein
MRLLSGGRGLAPPDRPAAPGRAPFQGSVKPLAAQGRQLGQSRRTIFVAIFVDMNLCPEPRPDFRRSTMRRSVLHFRLPPGTAGSSSFYLPEAEGVCAKGRNGPGGPPPQRNGRSGRLLFSLIAGDGGVQHGFRRRVGGAMKGAVAPSSSSSSSSSSSMQSFENENEDEDEDEAASLLRDPTGLAQPGQRRR